ncbi:cold shock domain-containing protein [Desulfobacterota bacterium AH_259_B03_O07]|nr:cold shock domain-containing protein [Desulfobacterota bacterium AH_259_B03_O07]
MVQGKIKKILEDKGFGFIRADDSREIFFHKSGLQGVTIKDLKEGDPVEFDVEKGPDGRGPRAVNVKRASD